MKAVINKKIFPLLVPLASVLLTGCFMAPGATLKPGDIQDRSWFSNEDGVWFPGILGDGEEPEPPIEQLVDIQPITPTLLTQQLAAQAAVSQGARPPTTQFLQEFAGYDYLIGTGDVVHITVYDHPELTMPAGTLRSVEESGIIVRSDGSIFYPYIGSVQVAGRTVEDVRATITEQLAEFVNLPQVDMKVVGFRSQRAFVTGQVAEPGPRPITNVPLTVLDAISQAGGLTDQANWHNVILARENGEEVELSLSAILNQGRLDQNLLLRHGDVLHVPDLGQQKVFVMGELNRISSLPMGNLRMSLTDALSQAGGINQVSANASGIFVIRGNPIGDEQLATVYQLDASNALSLALGSRFMLEPADIVFVTTAPVTRWNRVINQLVPSLGALFQLDRLGN